MQTPLLPPLRDDEYYYLSQEGLVQLCQNYDVKDPQKNILWTSDYTLEIPIRMKKEGVASLMPATLVEKFKESVKKYGDKPSLATKINNTWVSISYKAYFDDVCAFAKGLLSLELTPFKAVNIIGFNSAEWFIAFYGSIFGYYLPVGIYTTNAPDACQYVASHSDCELVVVENRIHLKKYFDIWDSLPQLKAIVVYNDPNIPEEFIPLKRRGQIFQWKSFLDMGRKYKAQKEENSLESRMKRQKPGNCCTLVYTSGTTGQPKGVMLSHDNYVFPSSTTSKKYTAGDNERLVSYLPLSHVAAQIIDIIGSMISGSQVFFAGPDALSGSLIETLKEVKPTFFFSVPRVWEKIEEKMKLTASSNGFLKKAIANWAKGLGKQGTFALTHNQSPPFCFNLANKLVYHNVKKALGLDEAKFLMFGAAPLSPIIRDYFLSLNIFLINGYGMSECAGAETLSNPENFDKFDNDFLLSTGSALDGTEIRIFNPDKDGNGEICYRGRNIFKGYYKNEKDTRETLDADGFLHSGDVGKLDKRGNLKITGRIKELLITAGGENVAPVLIENEIKEALKVVSNAMVVGDAMKYLTVLLTLKYDVGKDGSLTTKLTDEVINEFKNLGSQSTNLEEVRKDPIIMKYISDGIAKANLKAISNAQHVKRWALLDGDFTVDGGDLTPTLKLKRKVVAEKHQPIINTLYLEPKL